MAIPVFYKVKERFPSPQQLADPNNSEEILGMIRHLGLARNRLATIRKFAAAFVNAPPTREKLYQVKKYDKRDVGTISTQCSFQPGQLDRVSGQSTACNDGQVAMDAWEIGHITQGKYTLDSWRIFCRDELLGRAEDWKGEGRGPDFQPEWTRVRPHDKELRAYLRWMWMRAGWEWDPATGERKALGCELREAVNEERVGYDDSGGLQILNRPRQCS
ncbi:uncharacterized protein UV8b_02161 [Ustilaginoidea virens]|uniref:Pre-mRNA splicing factor n=1 Tax=Ustilaginoidea virens TaxID=1159556 RepID=A0A8E5HLY8_USTVR|nr:uncharacterized protein UV8b_02161 [Ustilaginoidea virens]QUC17920.1 hypothetical protein UV8b_02161 [Ustilaginoidea virens]